MNVYKVQNHYIAAELAAHAWYEYMEATTDIEYIFDHTSLNEGESEDYPITIKRLTEKEIDTMTVPCCQDGCEECEELDEHAQYTFRQLINRDGDFPRVIAFDL